jgi:hypothetical protein
MKWCFLCCNKMLKYNEWKTRINVVSLLIADVIRRENREDTGCGWMSNIMCCYVYVLASKVYN